MHLYPKHILTDLEFDFVKKSLGELTVTKGGLYKVDQLKPSIDIYEIQHGLHLVNEFLSVYQTQSNFPSMAMDPLKEEFGLLRIKNAVLSSEQILNFKRLMEVYNQLHLFFVKNKELLEESQGLIIQTPPNKEIPQEIDKVIDRHGLIKSSASPELAEIRNAIERKRQSANRIFDRAIKKYEKQNFLADFSETVQEDRRVLAIHSGFKNKVNGIIHGSSAKSSLVFIEPGECIEVNNELASLKDDEQKELRRILRNLTRYLSEHRHYLREVEKLIAEIDFVHAKALYAFKMDAVLPELVNEQLVVLQKGVNPVLDHFNKMKGKPTIPLDITLLPEGRIVVISGPNAGGKSIALKTIGLFQMMIQSGLLLPVHPKSKFGIFQKIMVDIGDAQSIENELSTYSSKLQKMRHFMEHGDDMSMILIDEFGSGSDPDLGGALAQVFLERLAEYGVYGILTTHYNTIKALASRLKKVENASMLFDKSSFKPEYVINQGIPGSSYTFEVAQKSGIPKHIIEQAKNHLDQPQLETDRLLVKIQDEKQRLTKARVDLQKKVKELEQLKVTQQQTILKLENKLQKQAQANEEMSGQLMWGKRFESLVKVWMHDSSNKNKKVLIGKFVKMMKERAGQATEEIKLKESKAAIAKKKKLEVLLAEEIEVGDRVRILSNQKRGSVEEIRRNKYLILLGGNITILATRDQFVKSKR